MQLYNNSNYKHYNLTIKFYQNYASLSGVDPKTAVNTYMIYVISRRFSPLIIFYDYLISSILLLLLYVDRTSLTWYINSFYQYLIGTETENNLTLKELWWYPLRQTKHLFYQSPFPGKLSDISDTIIFQNITITAFFRKII